MNSNRNSNRRRGRGGSRGSGGGGNQSNRIDSRARGNAPQLLEKYKKLAHDASLNDDRVQTEYYLQFADHYFRVIADNKAQKEEARAKREGERENASDDEDSEERDDRRNGRKPRSRRDRDEDTEVQAEEQDEASANGEDGEDNPFVRDTRKRRPRTRARTEDNEEVAMGDGVDPGVLPPAITKAEDDGDEAKKPVRSRSRRNPPADDSDGEALETVS